MRTIYKYELKRYGGLQMPFKAKPLFVAMQGDKLCLWASFVDANVNTLQERRYQVVPTGRSFDDKGYKYVGSVLVNGDRKSTRLNSSHVSISYAVFCLKKKKKKHDSYSYIKQTNNKI